MTTIGSLRLQPARETDRKRERARSLVLNTIRSSPYGMVKKVVRQGRSEQRGEAYFASYVEPLNDARTKQAAFFTIPFSGN